MPLDSKPFDGAYKYPVTLQTDYTLKASDSTTLWAQAVMGKSLTVHNAVTHKLDDNKTVKLHNRYREGATDVGIEFSYTH